MTGDPEQDHLGTPCPQDIPWCTESVEAEVVLMQRGQESPSAGEISSGVCVGFFFCCIFLFLTAFFSYGSFSLIGGP